MSTLDQPCDLTIKSLKVPPDGDDDEALCLRVPFHEVVALVEVEPDNETSSARVRTNYHHAKRNTQTSASL